MSETSGNSNFKELGIEAKYKTLIEEKDDAIVDKDADLMDKDISLKEKDS